MAACCVCYELEDVVRLPCEHSICIACLKRLYATKTDYAERCPVCRTDVRRYILHNYPRWRLYHAWCARMSAREYAIQSDKNQLRAWFRKCEREYRCANYTIDMWIRIKVIEIQPWIESRSHLRVLFHNTMFKLIVKKWHTILGSTLSAVTLNQMQRAWTATVNHNRMTGVPEILNLPRGLDHTEIPTPRNATSTPVAFRVPTSPI
jgi:hypothetical protein